MSQERLAEYLINSQAFITEAKKLDSKTSVVAPNENEWSPAFVLHHLADAEMHFLIRYFNALTIEKPTITPFDEDVYPSTLNYAGRDWVNSLALIESISKLVQATLSSLSKGQWERVSLHPQAGEISLTSLISKASNHISAHTEQLKQGL